jgi:hypothetical protein
MPHADGKTAPEKNDRVRHVHLGGIGTVTEVQLSQIMEKGVAVSVEMVTVVFDDNREIKIYPASDFEKNAA